MTKILRIENVRWLLILGVVLIHCNIAQYVTDSPVAARVIAFFSFYLTQVCVPGFFLISGLLMGRHHDEPIRTLYPRTLKSRCRSLLIPYIGWNVISLLVRVVVNLTPLNAYTQGLPEFDNPLQWLSYIFIEPCLVPMWFIRNLMLFVLLLPCVQWMVRRFGLFGVAVFYVIVMFTPDNCAQYIGGVEYYVFGYYLGSRRRLDLNRFLDRCRILFILYLGYEVVSALGLGIGEDVLRYTESLIMSLAAIGLLGWMSATREGMKWLTPRLIFFVYAIHGMVCAYLIKALLMLLHPAGIGWCGLYLLVVGCVLGISIGAYFLSERLLPRLTLLLTGSRHPLPTL